MSNYEFSVYASGADETFDSFLRANSNSKCNPLDLIEGNLIVAPVIESSGPRGFVAGHLLGDLQFASVLQVGGDAGGAEAIRRSRDGDAGAAAAQSKAFAR